MTPMGLENNLSPWGRMRMATSEGQSMPLMAAPTQTDINQAMAPDPRKLGSPDDLHMQMYLDSPAGKALLAQMDQYSKEAIAGQRQGVSDAENQLASYKQIPMQLDLSPLAQLTDSWTGSNLQKGYAKPEGIQDRVGTINALQGGLQKARSGLSTEQLQYMKDRFNIGQKSDETKAQMLIAEAKLREAEAAKNELANKKGTDRELAVTEKIQKSDEGKQAQGLTAFVKAVDDYKKLIDQFGLQPVSGPEQNLLKTAYSAVKIKYKEAANLGALSGPDIGLVVEGIPDATDKVTALRYAFNPAEGKKAIMDSLASVKAHSDKEFDRTMSTLQGGYGQFGGQGLLNTMHQNYKKASGPDTSDFTAEQLQEEARRRGQSYGH